MVPSGSLMEVLVQLGAQAGLYVGNILLPQGLLLCLFGIGQAGGLALFASSLMRAIFSCVIAVLLIFSENVI